MPTHVLGISAFYHDAAAALVRDGDIVAAAQEERFTRKKHDSRYPRRAVEYCLEDGGIQAGDLDYVVFYEEPLLKIDRLLETYLAFAPAGFSAFRSSLPIWVAGKLDIPGIIRSELGAAFRGEIHNVDHHVSHAASAFFPSPFEEAAILTLDAVGEWTTSSIGRGSGNRLILTRDMRFPHSLGMLYSAFTYYTGFKVNSGEYKVMGLAPYGEPLYAELIRENLVRIADDGSVWIDMSYFSYCHGRTMTSEKFHRLFGGPPRPPESRITQREMDLAASIQLVCEEVVLKAAWHAHRVTGMRHLVMAGGVALNCVANGRISREGPFERIWVQPAAGDAGGALGAALFFWHQHLGRPRTPNPSDSQRGSLLGPAFEDADTALFLDSVGAVYDRFEGEDELLDEVVNLLAGEEVIGWFSGRMEYGPRALGSRSIIGDARSRRMQQTMNLKIKFRESFRPFAPCVLREYAHQVFEMRPDEESPYMLFVAPVRKEWRLELGPEELETMKDSDLTIRVAVPRSTVPAITHVDYSARVQTVDPERHGRFYRLMKRFHEQTACPVIVNTSFNIRGEPIVCTPEDAYRCFMATDMDYLVLGNLLLAKDRQPAGLLPGLESYRQQHPMD
jgi:carbamoyltransferase